jgi:hypothetical protein
MCVSEDGFQPGAQVGVGLEIGSRRIRKKREQKRAEQFQRTTDNLLYYPGKDEIEIPLSTTLVFHFPHHRLLGSVIVPDPVLYLYIVNRI